VTENRR